MSFIRNIKRLIREIIREELSRVRTHMPVKVISYDDDTNLCSVQPCVESIRIDDPNNDTVKRLPVLNDVPVQQFGSGKCLFSVAPQAGSYGTLHISDRDISKWLDAGDITAPGSSRQFDLSDAFFEPGIYPTAVDGNNGKIEANINTDRIELRTRAGTTYISVLDDGNIEITSNQEITFNGGTDFAVAYTDLKSAFDSLKSDLNTFIVLYNAHLHPSVGIPPNTDVPTTTGVTTSADMSGAKIAAIRLP